MLILLKMLTIFLFGLILTRNACESRAVNISNTWTLPSSGFTVFYRFFRDQISWFEADAVCQFHHANLVTVDNSEAFDASKNFLKELDVTEPVWIGLMRSQSSDKFLWSNSKVLSPASENWADPLPLIDAPLCAVIDPIRDYRWHALRCGGPETASFLCEMNVPKWAEECIIENIPSLTIQYMADSGTVEITKDCGNDEGSIHTVCRGKQDHDRIMKNLVCKNEPTMSTSTSLPTTITRTTTTTTQTTSISPSSINSNLIDTHKESLNIIKYISSDNNEDNNINTQPIKPKPEELSENTENPVQRIIDQFSVEELMQADQPPKSSKTTESKVANSEKTIIDNNNEKPIKKLNKKVKNSFEKKNRGKKQKKLDDNIKRGRNIDDMMMGDQPMLGDDDVLDLNQIQEPLPHQKKMLPQDLKHEDDEKLIKDKEHDGRNKALGNIATIVAGHETIGATTVISEVSSAATSVLTTSTEDSSKPEEAKDSKSEEQITTTLSFEQSTKNDGLINSEVTEMPVMITTSGPVESKTATIGHPMHPQQPRSNVISEETGHHKETNDNHFIPPMLMVKSHYIAPKSSHEAIGEKHEITTENQQASEHYVSTTMISTNLITTAGFHQVNENTQVLENEEKVAPTTFQPAGKIIQQQENNSPDEILSSGHQVVEIKIGNSDNPTTFSITTRPISPTTTTTIMSNEPQTVTTFAELIPASTTEHQQEELKVLASKLISNEPFATMKNDKIKLETNTSSVQEKPQQKEQNIDQITSLMNDKKKQETSTNIALSHLTSPSTEIHLTDTTTLKNILKLSETTTQLPSATTLLPTNSNSSPTSSTLSSLSAAHVVVDDDVVNLDDENNFQPYFKPNRRRSLTHSEQASYIKKILG